MAAADTNSSWDKIRQGVKDAEVLIGQKKYNLSMVKARQTLEYMVRSLCEKACIAQSDLASSIDALYSSRWITKTTCEHYHKIRMLGNKAVHEGSENSGDANQAYHLLSQEVYTYANEYRTRRRRPAQSPSGSRSRKRKPSQSRFPFTPTDLARIGIILAAVVALILIIRLVIPKKEKPQETTPAPLTTEATLPETTTAAPETMAETTPAPVYKTSDNLNVRAEPSTSAEKLGLLDSGTVVDYVRPYDDDWAVINYNGREAYVSSQFLVHD